MPHVLARTPHVEVPHRNLPLGQSHRSSPDCRKVSGLWGLWVYVPAGEFAASQQRRHNGQVEGPSPLCFVVFFSFRRAVAGETHCASILFPKTASRWVWRSKGINYFVVSPEMGLPAQQQECCCIARTMYIHACVPSIFRGRALPSPWLLLSVCLTRLFVSTSPPILITLHTRTKFRLLQDHFGAVLAGRRGGAACPRTLELKDTTFTGCSVDSGVGAGGAVAVFDTTAEIVDCVFEGSQGTAVLFESSSAVGQHKLDVSAVRVFLKAGA